MNTEEGLTVTIVVIIACIFFLANIFFVWWTSKIMCKNLGYTNRARCFALGVFLPFFYWPVFWISFLTASQKMQMEALQSLDSNIEKPEETVSPKKSKKSNKIKKLFKRK